MYMFVVSSDYNFVSTFSDLECKVPVPAGNSSRSSTCQNIAGTTSASAQGMCNYDPTQIPLPSTDFSTEV